MSQAAEDWIHSFDRFDGRAGIKPGLQRMEAMLERLGNPHHQLKFLHVAGTNGKGSTCAFLAAILEEAGYQVGLYTSPYLEQFNDRMSVSGQNISDRELDELVARLRPIVEDVSATSCGRPTEFEVVTTLSFMHYARQQVDFVVLETGLGGRLDSTNVVTPLLSLITNVGRDHEAILGSTLEMIAAEKAGIIKRGIPVITTATGVARDVIVAKAAEVGSLSYEGNRDFSATRKSYSLDDGQTFDWSGWNLTLTDLRLQMLGAHQIVNASLAVAACMELCKQGVVISEGALRDGLARTRWAGRLEVLERDPLLLLDGAHNPEGAQVLGQAIAELLPHQRIVLVIGILGDKAIPEVLAPVVPRATHVIVTRPNIPRAAVNDTVASVIRDIVPNVPVETADTVRAALQLAKQRRAEKADCILVTGSLYTISEARAILLSQQVSGTNI
jgi:dihydrofolate synthase / folylpolyglutamate synthase